MSNDQKEMIETFNDYGIGGVQKALMVKFLQNLSYEELSTFVEPFKDESKEEPVEVAHGLGPIFERVRKEKIKEVQAEEAAKTAEEASQETGAEAESQTEDA